MSHLLGKTNSRSLLNSVIGGTKKCAVVIRGSNSNQVNVSFSGSNGKKDILGMSRTFVFRH